MEDDRNSLPPPVPFSRHPLAFISPVILALSPEAILREMVAALDLSGAYAAFMSIFDEAGTNDPPLR